VAVGVFVDLKRGMGSGGHVKCWERFAEAAAGQRGRLDLTVHFLGSEEKVEPVAENVRYITHPPVIDTSSFKCMERLPGHTDLAPYNPKLIPYLGRYDVLHTTGAFFALSRTARRFARRHSRPLVSSIHTDTPKYTRVFAVQILKRLIPVRWLHRLAVDTFRFPDRSSRFMIRRLERFLSECDWVLASRKADLERLRHSLGNKRITLLRRGVDKEMFQPGKRDRRRLAERFGIPPERFVLLYAGRLDEGKNIMTVAEAARIVRSRGHQVQVIMVGQGGQAEAARELLGPLGIFPGVVPPPTLAWLYASADLFVFPSDTEVCPNVVIEARASGLPVLVSQKGGSRELVGGRERSGFQVAGGDAQAWASAIEFLLKNRPVLQSTAEGARRSIERSWPSWAAVLEEDLLPVWESSSGRRPPCRLPEPVAAFHQLPGQ